MVAGRNGRIYVQTRAKEVDVGQLIGVGLTALGGVEFVAQGELDDAGRDEVERCPDALFEQTQGAVP